MIRGKYIVIEGAEGVGKTTQVNELSKKLFTSGLPTKVLREPDSQNDLTARTIRHITQDQSYPMNTRTEVLLYNAARSQSLEVIKKCLDNGVNCLVDRNYLTTLAVQYYGRGDIPDYDLINSIINFAVNGLEPDLTIILDAPVTDLLRRLRDRSGGERFDSLGAEFLERVRAGYLWEANQRKLPVIFANKPVNDVADEIWQYVAKTLSNRTDRQASLTASIGQIIQQEPPIMIPKQTTNQTKELSMPYLTQDKHTKIITPSGHDYLNKVLTNNNDNVYAFYNYLTPATIAAAMARLSRRGDDLRVILLDEFADKVDKDSDLLKRVITAYGDDSVQQLVGIHLIVEDASNLLTKKLEWGRMAAYLEQSTRYIYYDHKDVNGNYHFYTPEVFKPKVKQNYQKVMNQIFDIYSELVHALTTYLMSNTKVKKSDQEAAFKAAVRAQACDAVRSILPVAVTSTVGIFASAQAIESLIMHLQSDELIEASVTGKKLLTEARKVIPMFLERADLPDRGGAIIAYRVNNSRAMTKLVEEKVDQVFPSSDLEEVVLSDYWPHNELDIVADMLYEYSHLSLKTIRQQIQSWSYEQKAQVIKTYMGDRLNRRQRPGRALEKIHYSFDLVCDYGIFRDLQRHRMVDGLVWQKLTPRYGYHVPKLIEDAFLTDKYEECFSLSLQLYSDLCAAGYTNEAQYATLLGHKMRWKITYNAREALHLHELRTSPQGHPGYRKLVNQMHNIVENVHPLIAESMIFVNKGEDPELNRLGAERYTQLKLKNTKQKSPE